MKYKIQAKCVWGWGDLKYSDAFGWGDLSNYSGGDKTYQVDLYDTKEQAEEELKNILSEFGDDGDNYRIVTEDVLEDFNIYAE